MGRAISPSCDFAVYDGSRVDRPSFVRFSRRRNILVSNTQLMGIVAPSATRTESTISRRLGDLVGNTPFLRLRLAGMPHVDLLAKLELQNPTGSTKDRAANFILDRILDAGQIRASTQIVESSSGNFGIALAAACRARGLSFTCVIDPFILPINEYLIRQLGGHTVKVTEPDPAGGYLQTRIARVKAICDAHRDSYWINQYGNELNGRAYEALGRELCDAVERLDYVFVGVSSGGTIAGVSRYVKRRSPNTRVIAVDMRGSVIFGDRPRKRSIPGIGSSIVPPILSAAQIDEVVHVDERETILGCRELLAEHSLFCGGSSGSVLAAVKKYFAGRKSRDAATVAAVLADRGDRYADSIYDDSWAATYLQRPGETQDAVSQ
jgi:2,3-diaminopropionate biosynthesis protein SbnA